MVKLDGLISSKQMKLDIPMLSTGHQTSELEGYHSVVNQFAPLTLAALHFNENVGRDQAVNSNVDLTYKIVFPKNKKGGYTVREVMTEPTYNFVRELTGNVIERTNKNTIPKSEQEILPHAPLPLCFEFEIPAKEHAISVMLFRFGQIKSDSTELLSDDFCMIILTSY
ncbi:uncharacterized protein [Argopecten irradians]|uniref:uncharacterized protein n=1 Tax=Argopecten irradians TaxID=31199 RepID=UPI00372243AF